MAEWNRNNCECDAIEANQWVVDGVCVQARMPCLISSVCDSNTKFIIKLWRKREREIKKKVSFPSSFRPVSNYFYCIDDRYILEF